MKAFQFTLEALLRLNKWKEDEAQKAWQEEIIKLRVFEEKLKGIAEEIVAQQQERGQLGDIKAEEQLRYLLYRDRLALQAEEGRKSVRKQRRQVLQRTAGLLVATRERKKMEKIREKRSKEHRHHWKKKETAIQDEAASNLRLRLS